MRTSVYTVIGLYIDDEPVVAGVIPGSHPSYGGEGSEFQPWAVPVTVPDTGNVFADVAAAEVAAVAELDAENGDDDGDDVESGS